MNKNDNIKNKFLKNIALGSFLFGSFAGILDLLQKKQIALNSDKNCAEWGIRRQKYD
jgi:hypothetical protein